MRVKNFGKEFGNNVLLEKAELTIHRGDKVALLGQNGTGKTTFIKCLADTEDFTGELELNASISFAIMEQERVFDKSDLTFAEYLENKKNQLMSKKSKIEEEFANPDIYDDEVLYAKLLDEHLKLSIRAELNIDEENIRGILDEISFEMVDYDKKICSLSGGQRTKLRLAEVLSRGADFFVLDEPTNHLDFETIRWLEKRLFYGKDSFIVVSHDRYFVNLVSERIIEIENKVFVNYDCDYVDYIKKRKKHLEELKHKHYVVNKEKKRLKASELQKREWAHLVGSKKMKVQADKLARKAKDLGDPSNPDEFIDNYELEFKEGKSCGNMIFKAEDVCKSFGDSKLFADCSFKIENGDKIAILGKNGCGKTTLIKVLNKKEKYDEGVVKFGDGIKVGYLDQEFKDMNPKQKVMDFLWEADQKLMEHHIIANLIKFGFDVSRINDKLEKLSGGEKTRISFVKLMLSHCNVLLLDEPTNNLDVELIQSLEKALKKFRGTVVFVSHDRMFINKVAQKLFVFEDKKIKVLDGNYSANF